MRIVLIIVCVLPGLIPVRAQDSVVTATHHYFGYNPGYIQLKEMNLIPKVHNGMINAVTYCFERTGRNYQSFHFLFGYSNPKTSIERESPDFQNYRKNLGTGAFQVQLPVRVGKPQQYTLLSRSETFVHLFPFLLLWMGLTCLLGKLYIIRSGRLVF